MNSLLLAMTALLGLLAFFEPCTVATNTLFAVRTHRLPHWRRSGTLLMVWGTRSLLLGGLLYLITVSTTPPDWGAWFPSLALAVMAFVYVLSRRVYLPVPHLAFDRLLPAGANLPDAVRLGLTLPACTLPLVLLLAGVVMTLDVPLLAFLAGVLFATFFTLPLAVAALRGVHEDGRQLLDRAGRGTPWLTAAILLLGALALLLANLDVDADSLRRSLQQASWAGVGLAFLAGFVFSFNPVSFASIPVVLAYVTKAGEERKALATGSAFVLGMLLTHVVLGVVAALGGEWVQSLLGRHWGLVLGPLLILLGLIWPGWLRVRLPGFGLRGHHVSSLWGAFLLGIPFTVAVCPFCTPALLVTLTASAAIGSPGFGAALLLAFAIGRSLPILLGAWGMGWLESLRMLSRHQRALEQVAGITLILTGLYLLNEYFFILPMPM